MSQATSLGSTTIEGIEFEIYPLDPWIANEILAELSKIVGPSLGELVGGVFGGGDSSNATIKESISAGASWADAKINPDMLSKSISGLFLRFEASTLRAIMERLAAVTVVKGAKENGKLDQTFQAVFLGKPGAMYHWAGWAIERQFQSVFGSIPAAIEWFGQRAALGA